jgi:ABC-2 type transport system permease protein
MADGIGFTESFCDKTHRNRGTIMNLLICLCEIKNLLRERLLWLLVGITIFFTALASYNGYQWVVTQNEVIHSAQQEQQQAVTSAQQGLADRQTLNQPINWWDDQYDLRGQAFYLMVNYATKPPLPSAALAVGQSDVQPYFFRMLVTSKQAFINQYEFVHPLALLIGKFDLAFFIIYVLPLLLISVGFNALAQEKESGQLRLLMLQGLSPMRLLFNQLVIRASIIILPLLFISISALLLFSEGIGLISISLFIALVFAYSAFWLALSALVISYGNTSAYNAAVLVIAWLSLVIIIPAVLNTAIVTANTAPSRIEYVDNLRDKSDAVDKSASKVMAQYFQDHPELALKSNADTDKSNVETTSLPSTSYATKKIAKIAALETAMQPYDDAFQNVLMTQQNYAEKFSYLSPATIVQGALFELSGNGLTRHQHFIDQVLSHHKSLRYFYQQQISAAHHRGDFTPCEGCNARVTLSDLAQVPKFTYQEKTSGAAWGNVLMLWLFSAILLVLASMRLSMMNRSQASCALV